MAERHALKGAPHGCGRTWACLLLREPERRGTIPKVPEGPRQRFKQGGAADVTRLSRPLAATTGWGRPRVTPSKPSCPTWTIRSTRLLDDATCCLVLSQQNLHSTVTQRGKRRSSHPLRAPPVCSNTSATALPATSASLMGSVGASGSGTCRAVSRRPPMGPVISWITSGSGSYLGRRLLRTRKVSSTGSQTGLMRLSASGRPHYINGKCSGEDNTHMGGCDERWHPARD